MFVGEVGSRFPIRYNLPTVPEGDTAQYYVGASGLLDLTLATDKLLSPWSLFHGGAN